MTKLNLSRTALISAVTTAAALRLRRTERTPPTSAKEKMLWDRKGRRKSCVRAGWNSFLLSKAKTANDGQDFKEVAKGTCEQMHVA